MKLVATVGAAAAAMALSAGSAQAMEVVDDDHAQCPSATHTSIQAGIDAASSGETVLVCDGVYREAVLIDGAAKDGVRLVADVVHGATIRLPDNVVGSMVNVRNARNVQVRRFVIVADNVNGAIFDAVSLDRAGGARIERNVMTQDPAVSGSFFEGVQSFGGSRLRILDNRIENYEWSGVAIDDGSGHVVSGNSIAANPGPIEEGGAQTGVAFGGEVEVTGNTISGNHSNGPDVRGTGITDRSGFFGFSGGRISGNWVTGNDVGLSLEASVGVLVSGNAVLDNRQQGILVGINSSRTRLLRNDARGNGGLDCEDRTAGAWPARRGYPSYTTANYWASNKGLDADPAPICTPTGAAGQPVE